MAVPKSEEARKLDVVRKALRFWDPIGVIEDREVGTGAGDDEYDSYAIGLLRSIDNGNDAYRLARHLAGIRHNSMALGVNHPTEQEEELAKKLVAWRDQRYRGTPEFRFSRYAV